MNGQNQDWKEKLSGFTRKAPASITASILAVLILLFALAEWWKFAEIYTPAGTSWTGFFPRLIESALDFFILFTFPSLFASGFLLEQAGLLRPGLLLHPKTGMCLIVLFPLAVLKMLMGYNGPPTTPLERLKTLFQLSGPAFILLLNTRWWPYGAPFFLVWTGSALARLHLLSLLSLQESEDFRQIFASSVFTLPACSWPSFSGCNP